MNVGEYMNLEIILEHKKHVKITTRLLWLDMTIHLSAF